MYHLLFQNGGLEALGWVESEVESKVESKVKSKVESEVESKMEIIRWR